MIFVNESSKTVNIDINGTNYQIQGGKQLLLENIPTSLNVTLRPVGSSYKKLITIYLLLEVRYMISPASDDMEFRITHDQVQISQEGCYDRFFLWVNGLQVPAQGYRVLGAEGLKERLKKSKLFLIFLWGPLAEFYLIDGIFYILAIIIAYIKGGWNYLWLWLLLIYVGSVLLYWLEDKVKRSIQKLRGEPREKWEGLEAKIQRWTQPDYIAAFYAEDDGSVCNLFGR